MVAFLDDHSRFLLSYGVHASASTALVDALEAGICAWGPPGAPPLKKRAGNWAIVGSISDDDNGSNAGAA